MSHVRSATAGDIDELVRLRALLFERMKVDLGPPAGDAGWRAACAAEFRERLGDADGTLRAYVVDAGGDRLAACGIGLIERRIPSPYAPDGRFGQIFGVVTDPAHRRRGHARAIMTALLAWFRAQSVRRVDLYATSDGEPLYRSLGFAEHPEPTLIWRNPETSLPR